MSDTEGTFVLGSQNAVAATADVEALGRWLKDGSVRLDYLRDVLGDRSVTVTTSALSAAPEVQIRKTWHGRPVYTDAEMAKMECPYPPDPDL
jgi:hypothetical protein